jgi:YVTN family beta-propeller protein
VRTFLIADVRGYTRYTQEHGDEAAAMLASTFAGIVRSAVAGHEGDLIELRGDEALVVFGSAREALRAAVEVQRRCREQEGGQAALPLGVGIGLDAGEAVALPDGGYRGGALNLAARLCSIAAPGQILASEGVAHLARRVEGLQYRPRRAERLKGIDEPVKVNEVVPDTPLPPVPTIDRPPGRRRRARWLVSAAAAVAALGGGVLAIVLSQNSGTANSAIVANAAGLLESDGHLAAQIPIAGRPAGASTGAGALWVTDSVNATLLRVDLQKRDVVDRIAVGANPGGVIVAAGSVWVANSDDSSVSRIDTTNDKVVATIRVGNGPTSIASGDRSIWVLNTIDATISRISTQTGQTQATIPLGQNPTRVAFGLGYAWVTSEETGLLLRIDPATNSVIQAVPVGNGPVGIVIGNSAVWVANMPDRTVSRVDPASGSVTKVNLDGRPAELTYADGKVWAANSLDGTVTQIATDSNLVVRTIRTVENPAALAASGSGVWTVALPSSLAHRGGTLQVAAGQGDSFDTPDPGAAYRAFSWQLVRVVYDGLLTYRQTGGPSGGTIVPDLATALPVVRDSGRTYVFKLRKGLRYSNGAVVKPSDLRHAIEREYREQSGFTGLLRIQGWSRCTKRACDLSRGIFADDRSNTITIHLETADPDFLFKLALPFGSFVPPNSPPIPRTRTPLPGTGPYLIKRYIPGRTLLLVRNPYFREWSADAQPDGYPNRIQYTFGLDSSQATSAVESGKADFALDVPPPARLREIATRFSSLAHPYVQPQTSFFSLHTRTSPFNDVRVRRALNFALDRKKIMRLWGGSQLWRPTCQVLPPGIVGYRPTCPYTAGAGRAGLWLRPDVARARRLIAASDARGARVLVAGASDDPKKEAAARYMVGLLRQLGFRPRLRLYPDTFGLYRAAGNPRDGIQLSIDGWYSDFPRPSDFLVTLLSCAAYQPRAQVNLNAAGFCDRALDREMRRAQELAGTDAGASARLWSQIEQRVVEQAPWIPFLNGLGLQLTSKRVQNYQRNPQFGVLIDQLWVR